MMAGLAPNRDGIEILMDIVMSWRKEEIDRGKLEELFGYIRTRMKHDEDTIARLDRRLERVIGVIAGYEDEDEEEE